MGNAHFDLLAVNLSAVHELASLFGIVRLLVLNVGKAFVEHRMHTVCGHLHISNYTVSGKYLLNVLFGDVATKTPHKDARRSGRIFAVFLLFFGIRS